VRALAQETAEKLIRKLGGPQVMKHRGKVFAYTGWGLVIVFGCGGWWGPQFCSLITATALVSHLLALHAEHMDQ
jgi:hypothetical protein